jgi:hypothetical protein
MVPLLLLLLLLLFLLRYLLISKLKSNCCYAGVSKQQPLQRNPQAT